MTDWHGVGGNATISTNGISITYAVLVGGSGGTTTALSRTGVIFPSRSVAIAQPQATFIPYAYAGSGGPTFGGSGIFLSPGDMWAQGKSTGYAGLYFYDGANTIELTSGSGGSGGVPPTASYAYTSSVANSSSVAESASYAMTASYVMNDGSTLATHSIFIPPAAFVGATNGSTYDIDYAGYGSFLWVNDKMTAPVHIPDTAIKIVRISAIVDTTTQPTHTSHIYLYQNVQTVAGISAGTFTWANLSVTGVAGIKMVSQSIDTNIPTNSQFWIWIVSGDWVHHIYGVRVDYIG